MVWGMVWVSGVLKGPQKILICSQEPLEDALLWFYLILLTLWLFVYGSWEGVGKVDRLLGFGFLSILKFISSNYSTEQDRV